MLHKLSVFFRHTRTGAGLGRSAGWARFERARKAGAGDVRLGRV